MTDTDQPRQQRAVPKSKYEDSMGVLIVCTAALQIIALQLHTLRYMIHPNRSFIQQERDERDVVVMTVTIYALLGTLHIGMCLFGIGIFEKRASLTQPILEHLTIVNDLTILQVLLVFVNIISGEFRLPIIVVLSLIHVRQIDLVWHYWHDKTVFIPPSPRYWIYDLFIK